MEWSCRNSLRAASSGNSTIFRTQGQVKLLAPYRMKSSEGNKIPKLIEKQKGWVINGMETRTAFDRWNHGEMSAEEALLKLCQQINRVQDSLGPLEEQQKYIRLEMSLLVEKAFNGRARVDGFGELRITEPVLTVSYDRKELDELVMQLVGEGQPELARRIQSCRRESSRAGSLRIDRLRTTTTG